MKISIFYKVFVRELQTYGQRPFFI